jgi:hypothetical protein
MAVEKNPGASATCRHPQAEARQAFVPVVDLPHLRLLEPFDRPDSELHDATARTVEADGPLNLEIARDDARGDMTRGLRVTSSYQLLAIKPHVTRRSPRSCEVARCKPRQQSSVVFSATPTWMHVASEIEYGAGAGRRLAPFRHPSRLGQTWSLGTRTRSRRGSLLGRAGPTAPRHRRLRDCPRNGNTKPRPWARAGVSRLLIATRWHQGSEKTNECHSGFLGKARLIGFRGKPAAEGIQTWDKPTG